MAGKKGSAGFADAQNASKVKEVNRGTQDEMEVLGLILAQHPVLRQNVLEKLRAARGRVQSREKKKEPA